MDQLVWLRTVAVVLICGLCIAAWRWVPLAAMDPDHVSAWVEAHRHAWYALSMVILLAFVALGLLPVLFRITVTGVAFGIPLTLAWFINRSLRRARHAE